MKVSYPADIVLALCGDWLKDHFLAADAEENFFNFVQEFLQKKNKTMCKNELQTTAAENSAKLLLEWKRSRSSLKFPSSVYCFVVTIYSFM